MSAARSGVSAVAISSEPAQAPAIEAVLMAFLPFAPGAFPDMDIVRERSKGTGKSARLRHPRRGMVGGQYISKPRAGCHVPSSAPAQRGAAERAVVGSRWATFGCAAPPFFQTGLSGGQRCAAQGWQEVRSFSSMEKISPASTLMLRTRQTRPEVSLRLAS